MTPQTLTEQVRAGSSESVATAAKMGAAASPTLEPLADDKDADVRLWSLRCLDAIGGEGAMNASIKRLTDDDPQVASQAAMLLHHHPPTGKGPFLTAAFNDAKEPFVRAEIPKISGRIPTDTDTKVWLMLLPSVKDGQVRDGLLIGLAKMGHEPSREWFKGKLAAADGPSALPWLEAAEYLDDAWELPSLGKLLDRRSAVYTVSADFKPLDVRVCDLAAYVIFKIVKPKVEFVIRKGRYNDVQIDAARAAAAGKP